MRKHAQACVTISSKAQMTVFGDIYQRQDIEACGLLTGCIDDEGNWHIGQAHPLPNIFNSPVYFEFSPEDMLAVELDYPGKIVGVYHSHPTGLAAASSTDRLNMKRVNEEQDIPWVWLIVSGPFNETISDTAQTQPARKLIMASSVIAYHYYKGEGLRRITVQLEETSGVLPNNTP